MAHLRRRELVGMLGGMLAWPFSGAARTSAGIPRAGILWGGSEAVVTPFHSAFREGLRELGHVEGRTILLEARFAEGNPHRLSELAEELVRDVDVVVAPSTPMLRVFKEADTKIPIVMANVSDPVGLGFVASLSRPGGNITGFANSTVEQVGKNIELCKEAIGDLSRLAVLVDSRATEATAVLVEAASAGRSLGMDVYAVQAREPDELEAAVAQASEQRSGALLISTIEGFFFANRMRIIESTLKHRLPTVFAAPPYGLAKAGALLAYGASSPDMLRRAAGYVDRIIKGASPAELPVQQPTKFELGVNLNTAKMLGLTIPATILLRADEVIE